MKGYFSRIIVLLFGVAFLGYGNAAEPARPLTASELVAQAKSRIKEETPSEIQSRITPDTVIVDVRSAGEFQNGHIPGAYNIPRGRLEFAITSHPKLKALKEDNPGSEFDEEIIVYCKSGARAALAADTLQTLGFTKVVSIQGGLRNWEKTGLKTTD